MKIKSNVFKFCVAYDYPLIDFLCVKNMGFQKYPNCCGQDLSIHTARDVWEEEGRPGGESGEGGVLWNCSRTKKITNHESRISNFHFSFRVTQTAFEVPFLILLLGKGKRVSEKTAWKWRKEKARLQIATYKNSSFSFDAFIIFIYLWKVSKLKIRGK